MALTKGKRLGGAFLDLKELTVDGPVLCIFRIKEFLPSEKASGYDGINVPVVADVMICSGPRKGEVHLSEKLLGGITNGLRGVPNPNPLKNRPVLPPETEVGQEIVLRVKVSNPGRSNAGAVGDEPSDPEMDAAAEVYDGGKGWNGIPSQRVSEPATAGAGAGASKRPWE